MSAQTRQGAILQKQTILQKYGDDYFVNLGKVGGKAKVPKGFARMPKDKLRLVSIKGGQTSRR